MTTTNYNKCFIITFDIASQANIGRLIGKIKAYGTWANITNNAWAIVTQQSASSIRDNLKKELSANDRLFVVKSGIEAAWFNSECSNDWLKKNL